MLALYKHLETNIWELNMILFYNTLAWFLGIKCAPAKYFTTIQQKYNPFIYGDVQAAEIQIKLKLRKKNREICGFQTHLEAPYLLLTTKDWVESWMSANSDVMCITSCCLFIFCNMRERTMTAKGPCYMGIVPLNSSTYSIPLLSLEQSTNKSTGITILQVILQFHRQHWATIGHHMLWCLSSYSNSNVGTHTYIQSIAHSLTCYLIGVGSCFTVKVSGPSYLVGICATA